MKVTLELDLQQPDDKEVYAELPKISKYKCAIFDILRHFRALNKGDHGPLDVWQVQEILWDILNENDLGGDF